MKTLVARALVAVALLAGTACSEDYDPPSLLVATEPRLLAIEVAPLDAQPGELVTLTPRLYVPAEAPTARWRFCPLTTGARGAYACVVPACETALAAEPDGRVIADPTALALACLATLRASGGSIPGAPVGTSSTALPEVEVIEMVFTLDLDSSAGTRRAVARLPFYPRGAPTPRNQPPRIAGIELGGVAASTVTPAAPLPREGQLEIVVRTDASSLDPYTDAADLSRTEEPIVSFYSTAGRFESDRASGIEARGLLEAIELAPTDDRAVIYVVVRDGRGGQAVRGPFTVPVP